MVFSFSNFRQFKRRAHARSGTLPAEEPESPWIGPFVPNVIRYAGRRIRSARDRVLRGVRFDPSCPDRVHAVPSRGESHAMARQPTHPGPNPRHVSLIALPDAVVSTLFGIYDVMSGFALMRASSADLGARSPFHVEIVGETEGPLTLASGI